MWTKHAVLLELVQRDVLASYFVVKASGGAVRFDYKTMFVCPLAVPGRFGEWLAMGNASMLALNARVA